jgi:hypothetical protein
MPMLSGCLQNASTGSVGITFDADPSGRAQNLKVSGGTPEVDRCVATALSTARIPPFEGRPIAVQLPLSVKRETLRPAAAAGQPLPTTQVPAAAPPPPSAPAAGAPPSMGTLAPSTGGTAPYNPSSTLPTTGGPPPPAPGQPPPAPPVFLKP